jgi:hypothetical protein
MMKTILSLPVALALLCAGCGAPSPRQYPAAGAPADAVRLRAAARDAEAEVVVARRGAAGPGAAAERGPDLRFGIVWLGGCSPSTCTSEDAAREIARRSPLTRITAISSEASAGNADVIVRLTYSHETHTGLTRVEALSARSLQVLFRGQEGNCMGWQCTYKNIGDMLYAAFSTGAPAYQVVQAERVSAGVAVNRRMKTFAPPDRLALIRQAEQEGDQAQSARNAAKAFAAYTRALQGRWSDDDASVRVREKLMRLVSSYDALPDLPEEVHRHGVRGRTFLQDSRDPQDFQRAATEFMDAISVAPWWASGYFNLGLVQEQIGYLEDAIRNLKLYLLANPQADDTRAVGDKIYALEAKMEKTR